MTRRLQAPGAAAAYWRAAVLSAPLVFAACQRESKGEAAPASAPVPMVEIVHLARAADASAVRASGLLSYKRETALSFAAPGVIETLSADVGDVVPAGKTLATLRRTTVGADAGEAETARVTAEKELERVKTLHEKGFASDAALERARLAVERVRERLSIQATAGGVILQRGAERGQTVNAGTPVFVLGETKSGVVLMATLTANQAARIATGAEAQVNIRSGEQRAGKVARIGAKSADGTGAFEVEIALGDSAGLRSGEVADAMISAQGQAQPKGAAPGFVIPALSLIDARADQASVFVVDDQGIAHRRSIVTGGVSGEGVVVLEGLGEGDRVVASGAAKVRDGDAVRIGAQP